MFQLTHDLQSALYGVQALIDRGQNLSPLMANLAEGMFQRTQDRFDAQTGPDGEPWAALTPKYAARKDKQGFGKTTLYRTGRLRNEMRPEWGADFAEVSTAALPYAAIHQFGGRDSMAPGPAAIPKRPYFGISHDDEAWISETTEDWLTAFNLRALGL